MKMLKKPKAKNEKWSQLTESWKRRIRVEKGYSEIVAERIAQRIGALAEYMQYGHALIAYYKQDGTFQLVTGTLVYYPREFKQPYDIMHMHGTFVYWNVEVQGWRTFLIENFLEWRPTI